MGESEMVAIMKLCSEFSNNAQACLQARPDLHENACEVMQPYIEQAESVASRILEQAMDVSLGEMVRLDRDADFQALKLELIEIVATALPAVLDAKDVRRALPKALRGNIKAAQFLRERGAPQMADLCLGTPT